MGDPAGVGPEIIGRALALPQVERASRPVVIGDAGTMREALALIRSPLAVRAVGAVSDCRWRPGELECLDLGNVDLATLPKARVSAAAGRAAYEYVAAAVRLALAREIDAIVTAPSTRRRWPPRACRTRATRRSSPSSPVPGTSPCC